MKLILLRSLLLSISGLYAKNSSKINCYEKDINAGFWSIELKGKPRLVFDIEPKIVIDTNIKKFESATELDDETNAVSEYQAVATIKINTINEEPLVRTTSYFMFIDSEESLSFTTYNNQNTLGVYVETDTGYKKDHLNCKY